MPGRKPVREAIRDQADRIEVVFVQDGLKSPELGRLISDCRRLGITIKNVPKAFLDRSLSEQDQTSRQNHQGILARLSAVQHVPLEDLLQETLDAPLPVTIALDGVLDPGNVGVLARTLYALGGGGLIIPKHGSAALGAGAVRSSAGALLKLPVCRPVNLGRTLEACAEENFCICLAEAAGLAGDSDKDASENVFVSPPLLPLVLVLGSEEKGVRPGVQKRCQKRIHIPLARDFDSLNVAQAGAIILALLNKSFRF